MAKYNCMGAGEDGKKQQDKPLDGCAKSQSFYSGMNQLVHMASGGPVNSTLTTSPGNCKSSETNRVRTFLTTRHPFYSFNDEFQLQPTASSSSPAFSSSSTVILCPSQNYHRKLPPFPSSSVLVWQDHHRQHPNYLTNHSPSPYLYSSAYEVENSSPVSSRISFEHIYSQIPSPQPTPKFSQTNIRH